MKTAKEIVREAEDADRKAVEAAKAADIKHQEEAKIAQEEASRTRKRRPIDYISEVIANIGSPNNPAPSTADTSAEDTKAATEEFVASLPACKDVR